MSSERSKKTLKRYVIDVKNLPQEFPTHKHPSEFWEALGRTVATFGFLEETLGKAIFAFTATTDFKENEIEEAYRKWIPKLEKALSDPLNGLIDSYAKAVRDNSSSTISNLDELIAELREAATIRNVLCHGSWRPLDETGHSVPLYVNRKQEIFETPIGIPYFQMIQKCVVELAAGVVNSVTHMGWQFPGSNGPGEIIFDR